MQSEALATFADADRARGTTRRSDVERGSTELEHLHRAERFERDELR